VVSTKNSISQPSLEISPIWIPIISEVKGKVKAVSVYTIKVYGGVMVQVHAFLTSALNGNKWSVSHPPNLFLPWERASGTQ
jgi:hypothetical protein